MDFMLNAILATILGVSTFMLGALSVNNSYTNQTGLNVTELRLTKEACEMNLKRTETCHLVFIKSEE